MNEPFKNNTDSLSLQKMKIALDAAFKRERNLEAKLYQVCQDLEKSKKDYQEMYQNLQAAFTEEKGTQIKEHNTLRSRAYQLEIEGKQQRNEIERLQNELNLRIQNQDSKIKSITQEFNRQIEQLQSEKNALEDQHLSAHYSNQRLQKENQKLKEELMQSNERYCNTAELPNQEIESLKTLRLKLIEESEIAQLHKAKLDLIKNESITDVPTLREASPLVQE